MKKTVVLFSFLLCGAFVHAQHFTAGFEKATDTLNRKSKDNLVYRVNLRIHINQADSVKNYRLLLLPDYAASSLPATEYEIATPYPMLGDLNGIAVFPFFMTIKKDSATDHQRAVKLRIVVRNIVTGEEVKNTDSLREMTLVTSPAPPDTVINNYSYLAYVGTNFDLVDGIKAKHFFFASNILLQPSARNHVGAYVSLYGNRTMTTTDSTGLIRRVYQIRTLTDTTYMRYSEQARLKRNRVSDNLGAYSSALIRLGKASSEDNTIKLYYSPSLEFVWRRTATTSSYDNSSNRDSTIVKGTGGGSIDFGNTSTYYANEFNFNAGLLSVMIVHENRQISLRVHASVGYSASYYPSVASQMNNDMADHYESRHDVFFSGRAWITEATTGITLQAEITNNLKYPRPFYGVTLSKAINFKNLGNIFQPVVRGN
ncbi:hypothetical protein [Sediminibacterium ginsengisoli]|uniref:Uncharacterized protein n=1 Tax=Sediminibacterium ginsengisoli TaxID=413434 RepID=A0A1T4R3D4_9BACT|nr:hypothetical protein [Sediminibacterium ginsengisoli]SKA10406.1 hypothetical protein SAMN04488132_110108 [Sediminibacterium ginsengisoli]